MGLGVSIGLFGCGGPATGSDSGPGVDASACGAGQTSCSGACVDTSTDVDHCGSCGTSCDPGEVCAASACATSCPSGQDVCGGGCFDLDTSRQHCGACGDACDPGEICTGGACATSCPTGQVACSGRCVDPATDPGFCGASGTCSGSSAGTACASGEVCASGTCATSCPSGQVACGGRCVDPLTDGTYCGASGDCAGTSSGTSCVAGEVCNLGACETSCPSGQIACGGRCVDPLSDPVYCGASGDCAGANDGATCVSGEVCGAGSCSTSCPSGQLACSGACIDPDTDRAFCGASGACTGTSAGSTCGAGTACIDGSCEASCGAPLSECSGACVDTRTDPAHCGDCTTSCPTRANATATCVPPGTCSSTCNASFADCNANAADGCEVDVRDDEMNCGSCGNACSVGETCTSGVCEVRFTTSEDLSVTRTQGTCADGGDMVSYSVTGLNAGSATLSDVPSAGCLASGDRVLLISLQGAPGQTLNVGNYETLTVTFVSGNTVFFSTPKRRFYGTGASDDAGLGIVAGTQRVALQRVPSYQNVIIEAGATLSTGRWNGVRGGVFALHASGSITVAGTISMNEGGFGGGPRNTVAFANGRQGGSYGGGGAAVQGPNLAGGGGGLGEACATHGSAGGGAGHLDDGSPATVSCGGLAGLRHAAATRAYLGSGGGSGGADNTLSDNPPGALGGRGGGIVLLWSPSVSVTGAIQAGGGAGEGDLVAGCSGGASTTDCWDFSGPGGGGSGGSIVVATGDFSGTAPTVPGGVGGLGGPAGNGGAGSLGVGVTIPRTCGEALWWNPAATDGIYRIDPDGVGPIAAFDAHCDMANGGWTLVMATNGVGIDAQTATTPVTPGSARHLPIGEARALAAAGTQVHIRTQDLIDTESITSVPNTLAIQNLRAGVLLNVNSPFTAPSQDVSALWTGPRAVDAQYLWHTCGPSPHGGGVFDRPYPSIYWACNNGGGIHILSDSSAWTSAAGTPMEIYVR